MAVVVLGCAVAVPAAGSAPPPPPPVVVVVFDALPIQLLEDEHGQIDSERFPNFAAFAAAGTWYRHATTISESTRFSVPAILDGQRPRPAAGAGFAAHPRNLFTLLRGRYRMNVHEEATSICPVPLCAPPSRMTVIQKERKGRVARFMRGVDGITAGATPQLTFIHTLFPHEPRQYLPDGRSYWSLATPAALGGIPSINRRFLTQQVEQRELLQLQFTDRLLGRLIARLEAQHVWDQSLVALLSDHGESFRVKKGPAPPFRTGQLTFRRAASMQNLEDIAAIAMFVKYPDQATGQIDDRWVRHVDLLPTILREAGVARPPGLVGNVLTDARYRGHKLVEVYKQDGRLLRMPVARFESRARESKAAELALFGSGDKSLYDFGPAPQMLGTPVDHLEPVRRNGLRASVMHMGYLTYGRIRGGSATGHTLLFALNGSVVATAPAFQSPDSSGINFSAMLRPDAFRKGANRLEIFEWLGGLRARRLYG